MCVSPKIFYKIERKYNLNVMEYSVASNFRILSFQITCFSTVIYYHKFVSNKRFALCPSIFAFTGLSFGNRSGRTADFWKNFYVKSPSWTTTDT